MLLKAALAFAFSFKSSMKDGVLGFKLPKMSVCTCLRVAAISVQLKLLSNFLFICAMAATASDFMPPPKVLPSESV